MESVDDMKQSPIYLFLLLSCFLITACGVKGPLYPAPVTKEPVKEKSQPKSSSKAAFQNSSLDQKNEALK